MVGWPWPIQDGYDNERGDDSSSGQSDQMEQNINHPHCTIQVIGAANEKEYQCPLEKAYVNLHEHDKPVNVVNSNFLAYRSGHEYMLVILLLNLICKYLHPLIAMGNVLDVYMFS